MDLHFWKFEESKLFVTRNNKPGKFLNMQKSDKILTSTI